MFKGIAHDVKPVPNHTLHKRALWDAYISTEESAMSFDEYRSNGAALITPIHDNNDNLRGFEIEDTEGYVFFGPPKP